MFNKSERTKPANVWFVLFNSYALSNRHLHPNRTARFVSHQLQILHAEIVNLANRSPEAHRRKLERRPLDLATQRVDMIAIDVRIAERVHEIASA